MIITNELSGILQSENIYIEDIKSKLLEVNELLTDKSEHDLRLGFRTKAIIDIRLTRK